MTAEAIKETAEAGRVTAEHTKELKEYVDNLKKKYANIIMRYNTFRATTSFHTHFALNNEGTIPATGVKIRITYPVENEIQTVYPPMIHSISEDHLVKLFELELQRLDINTPQAILVTSSHEPIAPPEIQWHEQKSVKIASEEPI